MSSDVELVRYQYQTAAAAGTRPALIVEGRKWIKVVEFGTPISVRKVRREERRYMHADLKHKGLPYPLTRAARHFLRSGKAHGITEAAKTIVNQALSQ